MCSEVDYIANDAAIQTADISTVNTEGQISTPSAEECESVVSHASEVIWGKREFLIPNSDQE